MKRHVRVPVALSTLLFSTSLFAGRPPGQIDFIVAPASPIPTLGEGVLIALGLMMAVIAFRFLRAEGTAVKAIAAAFLTGGLAMGGLGVERSIATSEHTITADECTAGGSHLFYADTGRNNAITNACESTMEITLLTCTTGEPFPSTEQLQPMCVVGSRLAPDGGACYTPECPAQVAPE